MRKGVTRVYPQLKDVDFSHVWWGDVAYTLDHAPHLGKIDGIWHLGGYCGSGVTRAVYFGEKIARRILGQGGTGTAFDDLPFKPIPFRALSSLGAAALANYYAWLDQREVKRG